MKKISLLGMIMAAMLLSACNQKTEEKKEDDYYQPKKEVTFPKAKEIAKNYLANRKDDIAKDIEACEKKIYRGNSEFAWTVEEVLESLDDAECIGAILARNVISEQKSLAKYDNKEVPESVLLDNLVEKAYKQWEYKVISSKPSEIKNKALNKLGLRPF